MALTRPSVSPSGILVIRIAVHAARERVRGVARRGLLIRHLVLPGGLAGTAEIARFVSAELSPDTYVSVMGQYRPAYIADRYGEIDRPPTASEYRTAIQQTREAGLWRLDGMAL